MAAGPGRVREPFVREAAILSISRKETVVGQFELTGAGPRMGFFDRRIIAIATEKLARGSTRRGSFDEGFKG